MIDVHAHLNFQAFKDDYAEVIRRSFANGVEKIINIGSNYLNSQKAIQIAKEYKNCFAAVGLHPIHVQDEEFKIENYCSQVLKNIRTIKAIGETGLDYHYVAVNQKSKIKSQNDRSKIKSLQKDVFLRHLELAKEFDLPLILHCRGDKNEPLKAYEDLLSVIRSLPLVPRGELHCFSANWPMAQKFLDLGFYIGFTGIITFDNCGADLLEVVAKTPLDKILAETDCPYLAPQPVRRERCEPWHVKYTLGKIAEIKNISFEEAEAQIDENSVKLFNL